MNANIIYTWDNKTASHKDSFIREESILKLGIENEPTVAVKEWMADQEIETIAEFCEYVNHEFDANVELITF